MKTFQKIALVSAIAAAPFAAQADLTPMDDSLMGNTTGQAGVTIEIDMGNAGVTIGEVEYVDGDLETANTYGSVLLQQINISEADITQTIDVDADGSLVLGISEINNMTISLGNIAGANSDKSALALKSAAGEITEVVNDISLTMNMGATTTTLVNLQEAGNAAKYGITQSFDNGVDPVSNAANGSLAIKADLAFEITDLDVGAFGYTQEQADARGDAAGNGDGVVDAGLEQATADSLVDGSAVKLNNIRFYGTGGRGTNATVSQTIWAQGGTVAQGGGVYISMGAIAGTLEVGGIEMGGASIGAVKVSDINLAGMTQRIYGH